MATEPRRKPRPEVIPLPIRQPDVEIQIGSFDFSRLPLLLTFEQARALAGFGKNRFRELVASPDGPPVVDLPGASGDGKFLFKTTSLIRWVEGLPEGPRR